MLDDRAVRASVSVRWLCRDCETHQPEMPLVPRTYSRLYSSPPRRGGAGPTDALDPRIQVFRTSQDRGCRAATDLDAARIWAGRRQFSNRAPQPAATADVAAAGTAGAAAGACAKEDDDGSGMDSRDGRRLRSILRTQDCGDGSGAAAAAGAA